MNENTTVLLHMMCRLLKQFLELSNRIDEDDLREISKKIKERQKDTKSIQDALDLGNLFLLSFFLKQLLESITPEDVK